MPFVPEIGRPQNLFIKNSGFVTLSYPFEKDGTMRVFQAGQAGIDEDVCGGICPRRA